MLIYKVGKDHHRVAFARIRLADSPAVHWELAVTKDVTEEDTDRLQSGEFFGYSVDTGLGCFADVETIGLFVHEMNSSENYYNEVLQDEFEKASGQHALSRDAGDWNIHFPKKGDNHNIMMFSTGWGDGFYATYWGTDSAGKIVELITDFGVVGGE